MATVTRCDRCRQIVDKAAGKVKIDHGFEYELCLDCLNNVKAALSPASMAIPAGTTR